MLSLGLINLITLTTPKTSNLKRTAVCPRGAYSLNLRNKTRIRRSKQVTSARPTSHHFRFEIFEVSRSHFSDFEVSEVGQTQIIDFEAFEVAGELRLSTLKYSKSGELRLMTLKVPISRTEWLSWLWTLNWELYHFDQKPKSNEVDKYSLRS
jgi:hypothetical protein